MKYLLWALLIYVAWRWLAAKKAAADRVEPPSPPPPAQEGAAEKIVGCAHCGIHLPLSETVQGAPGLHFCSNEHRALHQERSAH